MASRPKRFVQGVLVIICCVSQVFANCSSTYKSPSECWYTLWYFWFVLILFIVGVTILLMFYFKIRSKNQVSHFRGNGHTNIVSMAQPPPVYMASYPPPSYEVTIRSQPPPPAYLPLPPGYVSERPGRTNNNRVGPEFPSTLSIGALSNPPPYSEHSPR